jgi:hypothetical protein
MNKNADARQGFRSPHRSCETRRRSRVEAHSGGTRPADGLLGAGASGAAKSWARISAPGVPARPPPKPPVRRIAPRSMRVAGSKWKAMAGPAQPSPTIGQCLNGGLGWLEVECNRCKTRASLPLDAICWPRDTPIWKLEAALKCRSCRKGRCTPPVHMIKLTATQENHAASVGAPGRGEVRSWLVQIPQGFASSGQGEAP